MTSPGQKAIEATLALALQPSNAPTWRKEVAIALAVYAAARNDRREQPLEAAVTVIRQRHTAAKQGDQTAIYAILDACDDLRTTAAHTLPADWMPSVGSVARPPAPLLDAALEGRQ